MLIGLAIVGWHWPPTDPGRPHQLRRHNGHARVLRRSAWEPWAKLKTTWLDGSLARCGHASARSNTAHVPPGGRRVDDSVRRHDERERRRWWL